MNYFAPRSAAARYAMGRPYFHPLVMERLQERLALHEPVALALDVGCGTGLSTVALKPLARRIIGLDIAAEMVALAPPDPQISYLVASAEQLPVAGSAFDLLTVSSVFHWLDHGAFLAEARRVLRREGWLVIYDNSFPGQMQENPAYPAWNQESYLVRYPSPPRARVKWGADEWAQRGWQLAREEHYKNTVTFTVKALVDYLVTQSNIIVAVEGGRESLDSVREWLVESIAPFYGNRREATFVFGGPIWYLQKTA